jgi:PAS domain-containing protein
MTMYQPITAAKTAAPRELNAPDSLCGRFVLDNDGVIASCDERCQQMFGAPESVLIGRHISVLVPKLAAKWSRTGWLSPNILFLSHCDIPFRTRRLDGTPFISALYFSRFTEHDQQRVAVLVRAASPQGCFGSDSTRVSNAAWCVE